MGQNSKIEWTDHTANLWWGCTKVHEGCDHCYAESLSHRYGNDVWGNDKPRKEVKGVWNDLMKYQKLAEKANEIHRVFVGSMMDIFEKPMSLIDSKGNYYPEMDTGTLRWELFFKIDAGMYNNLQFLFLTKRPSNINKYIPEHWKTAPPVNVMFGTSPVNQGTSYILVNQLLKVNGKRFLSVEPQLESISLLHWLPNIDWVIQGGESGPHKRPFNLDWAYDLKQQCERTNTPYFFKQIDKATQPPEDLIASRQFPSRNYNDGDFEHIYETNGAWPDYLKCKHCGERIERGMIPVSFHWIHCLKRTDGLNY
jgi:protein gp37